MIILKYGKDLHLGILKFPNHCLTGCSQPHLQRYRPFLLFFPSTICWHALLPPLKKSDVHHPFYTGHLPPMAETPPWPIFSSSPGPLSLCFPLWSVKPYSLKVLFEATPFYSRLRILTRIFLSGMPPQVHQWPDRISFCARDVIERLEHINSNWVQIVLPYSDLPVFQSLFQPRLFLMSP